MSRTRTHFSAEQKAAFVRRHLTGKEAVSDLAMAKLVRFDLEEGF